MNYSQNLDPRIKAAKTLCDKIRCQLDNLDLSLDDSCQNSSSSSAENVAEEERFGVIKKEEFEAILKAYDQQQTVSALADKVVKCDKVKGGSFAKLLQSRSGFHHLGSTAYLVDDLGIKDRARNSFLGGHSTYDFDENDSLTTIKKQQTKLHITGASKIIHELISSGRTDLAKSEVDKVMKLDCNHPDALASRGHLGSVRKEYNGAIGDLTRALESGGCSEPARVSLILSEALCERGMEAYRCCNYANAVDDFTESIKYNGANENAKLHLNISRDNLFKQRRPFGVTDQSFRYRK